MALKIPLRWLRDFVDYTATPDQLTETLTIAGLEVDGTDAVSYTHLTLPTIRSV